MDAAVLIASCDKYSLLWEGWYRSFAKHWHVEMPVYFISETEPIPKAWSGVSSIMVGPGKTWSEGVSMALDQIQENVIFFSLEDYWPTQDMDEALFVSLLEKFHSMDLLCLRCSNPCSFYSLKPDGTFLAKSRYLISCQTSFWDKEYFKSCLVPAESPWEFEIRGTERVRKRGLAHRTAFHPLPWYEHVCVRGNLTQAGKDTYQTIKKE